MAGLDATGATDFLTSLEVDSSAKEKFADLKKFADKFQIPKDQLKYLSSAKFTEEDKEIIKLQMEVKELNEQLSSDMEYYEKYLLPKKMENGESVSKLVQFPRDIKTKLEAINDHLMSEIDSALTIEYVDALEVGLSILVDTFTQALEPFLEVPNMPQIPLIGDLGEFLHTLSEMGKVERRIQQNLTPEQKRKWEEAREDQDYNIDENGKKIKKSFMEKLRDGSVGQTLRDIKDAFMEIIRLLPSLINFYWLALLNELIQLLKPVFDAFGIVAGTFMGLMESVPDLLTSSWKLAQTLGYKLLKIAYKKLESIFSIFYLIGDVEGSVDDQIAILNEDMLKCRYGIEEKNIEIKYYSGKKLHIMSEKELKKLEKQYEKTTEEAKRAVLSTAIENMQGIKDNAVKTEEDTSKALEEFRELGLEGYAKQVHKENVIQYDSYEEYEAAKSLG